MVVELEMYLRAAWLAEVERRVVMMGDMIFCGGLIEVFVLGLYN
jgi:hypothetical protein